MVMTQGAPAFSTIGRHWCAIAVECESLQGGAKFLWVANDKVDWSVLADRDAARGTMPSDDKIAGVAPFLCFNGNAADCAWGANRGSGGDFLTALLPGTTLS